MSFFKKFKPKYVAKVPIGKGNFRYFYTVPEYKAYLASKNKTPKRPLTQSTKKALPTTIAEYKARKNKPAAKFNLKNSIEKLSKSFVSSVKNIASKGKALVSKAIDKIGSLTTSKAKKLADKGKIYANKVFDKSDSTFANKFSKNADKQTDNKLKPKSSDKQTDSKLTPKNSDKNGLSVNPMEVSPKTPFYKKVLDKAAEKLFNVLNRKQEMTTAEQDMAAVNPNYGVQFGYRTNCGYCTMAYELRRRGYDVEANPDLAGGGITVVEFCRQFGIDLASYKDRDAKEITSKEILTDMGKKESDLDANEYAVSKKVETDIVTNYGEGSRGLLYTYWEDGGGHATAWEVENGKVVIRDAQINEESTMYEYISRSTEFGIVRLDDCEINESILNYVKNTKEVSGDELKDRVRFDF